MGQLTHSTAEIQTQLDGAYGGMHVHDTGAAAQSIPTGASYEIVTGFTDADESNGLTVDVANNKITITKIGKYHVYGSMSYASGTANINWFPAAFLDGVEQDQVHSERKTGTASDIGNMGLHGNINVTSVPVDLDCRIRHDGGGSVNYTMTYGNFGCFRLGLA